MLDVRVGLASRAHCLSEVLRLGRGDDVRVAVDQIVRRVLAERRDRVEDELEVRRELRILVVWSTQNVPEQDEDGNTLVIGTQG